MTRHALTTTQKTALLFSALIIGIVVVIAPVLAEYRKSMMEERQAKLQTMVAYVYDIVVKYYEKVEKTGMPRTEAQKYAFEAIKLLPYDNNGYCWINDMNGVMVMHPIKPELVGQNLLEYKDPNGKQLFKEFIRTVNEHKEGFVDYMWPKPDMPLDQNFRKLSFVKGFAPWGWVIGSGVYIDDVDNAFMHAVLMTGGLALMVLMFIAILIFTLTESIRKS